MWTVRFTANPLKHSGYCILPPTLRLHCNSALCRIVRLCVSFQHVYCEVENESSYHTNELYALKVVVP
jgi:hypothetical protein